MATKKKPEGAGPWRVLDKETGLKYTTYSASGDHLEVLEDDALTRNGSFVAPEGPDGTPAPIIEGDHQ